MTTSSLRLLGNAMTAYSWRLKSLSSNIANLDTPGYKRLAVGFEDALQRAGRGPGGTRDAVGPELVEQGRPAVLEDELMELADTQMRVQLAARALHDQFGLIRTGITGRSA